MSKKTRSVLKGYFNAGDQPSEAQFVDVFDSTLNLSEDNSITGSLIISGSGVSLSVQGNILADKLDTGQGLNELYDMNQNVKTDSAVTFATVNTGQGATEVHLMDQNVKTTNSPTFAGLTLTKTDYGTFNVADIQSYALEGRPAGYLLVRSVPTILTGANSATYTLTSENILATSVIMISTNALITCNATTIAEGSCKITFHNPTNTGFSSADVTINIVII
jgi:hypothetical protein